MDGFLVAVTLYVREGQEEAFAAYENGALARVIGHKGKVVSRIRCAAHASGEQEPYEFHLLSFPSEAAFRSFAASGVSYQSDRERLIAKTEIVTGVPLSLPKDR